MWYLLVHEWGLQIFSHVTFFITAFWHVLLSGVKLQTLDCECIYECHYCWFDKCCISLGCLNIYGNITNTTDITETGRKRKHVHSLQKYHIYLTNENNLHMNNTHTHNHNPIYETLQQTATPKSQTTYNSHDKYPQSPSIKQQILHVSTYPYIMTYSSMLVQYQILYISAK